MIEKFFYFSASVVLLALAAADLNLICGVVL
jgi:hypothetical protein